MSQITIEKTNQRLTRDLLKASMTLTDTEARFLVDTYYQMQDYRIATAAQCRSIEQAPQRAAEEKSIEVYGNRKHWQEFIEKEPKVEPHETLSFFAQNFENNETDIKKALHQYVKSRPIGRWLLSICGIGPVIAAGLMAHIDIHKAPTAGHIWNYAGLNPNIVWGKGQKRPYNAELKVLCYKIGDSFIKVQNKESDVYGHIMNKRIEYENKKNEKGDYKEKALTLYEKFKNTNKMVTSKEYYKEGKLSPSHIKARARRYAVKMFLSHLQAVWYELEFKQKPPKPFAIAILNHAHEIPVPNYELIQTELNKTEEKAS